VKNVSLLLLLILLLILLILLLILLLVAVFILQNSAIQYTEEYFRIESERPLHESSHLLCGSLSRHGQQLRRTCCFFLDLNYLKLSHYHSANHIENNCTRVVNMTSRRWLRSSASHRLDVPPVCLSTVGKRAFPVSGATAWNDLPLHVASAPSLAV